MHISFLAVVALYLLMMSRIWSAAHTAPVSVAMGKPDKDRVINLLWSADVSTIYPPRYAYYTSTYSCIQLLCMHVHGCKPIRYIVIVF